MRLAFLGLLFFTTTIGALSQMQNLTFFKPPGTTGITSAGGCYVNGEGTAAATIFLSQSNPFQAYHLRNGAAEILQGLPGYTRSFSEGISDMGEVWGE
jgi:hypothetical protein